jgi:small subunit ribosomal protein S16
MTVVDRRNARDGRVIEEVGFYDPGNANPELQCRLDKERIAHWLSVGAQPSETARSLIAKAGLEIAKK